MEILLAVAPSADSIMDADWFWPAVAAVVVATMFIFVWNRPKLLIAVIVTGIVVAVGMRYML